MDRRSFLDWMGVGILASSLPTVIVACSNSQNQSSATDIDPGINANETRRDNLKMIGTSLELEEKGFIVNENITGKPILVFRHPETGELIALDAKCTHQQCDLGIDTQQNILVCPCHDSHFSFDGKVLKNPAIKPLKTYEVKQDGYLIVVKID